MRTLNLGILAHVDAGKTTLTERLLFAAGVIDEVGSVDAGNTQTDTMALERQRGITIKSAVVSFEVAGVTVNLIDTPGHPDFIAEVERVLSVLDGAVLVISAVEGVQAQTRVLMRTLQRLRVPTLLFVNKIDRGGARPDAVLDAVAERLTPAIVPLNSARDVGTRDAVVVPYCAPPTAEMLDALTRYDDDLLADWVRNSRIRYGRFHRSLARQTGRAAVFPLYFGSAATGAGIDPLIAGIAEFLPAADGAAEGPVSGSVFKVERGLTGAKLAYVRMFAGTIRVRDEVTFGAGDTGKVTDISVFERGRTVRADAVTAGHIAKLSGLPEVRIGDAIGEATGADEHYFPPPTLETVVLPRRRSEKGRLHTALTQLAEQDPLIDLRQDDIRQEMYVSLYGEVQKEVIQATLDSEYGIEVAFRETTPICVERPVATGSALEILRKGDNPFIATAGVRIEPGPPGSGIEFRLTAHGTETPVLVYKTHQAFHDAIERHVRATLRQGLRGWEVTDCVVSLTDSGFISGTTARDFRLLVPMVLMTALDQAGTVVCEPVQRFHLEFPADSVARVMSALAASGAVPEVPAVRGSICFLEGEIASARVHGFQRQLSGLTHGEGVMESALDHYRPVRGRIPRRRRTDISPLDRREYLRHVTGKI
ncbi:MAG TPA: translation factor GTPase family protein [Mycobacteriales bacterium]|nr:translation factor GTPase family protein [Mycobacteriales bacterium]